MNSNQDLLQRLLYLYPVQELQDFFGITGKIGDVIFGAIQKTTQKALKGFAYNYHPFTKQNIYLFELDKVFSRNTLNNLFPLEIESEILNNGEYTFFCLPKVTYSVYLNLPITVDSLDFYQPLTIKIKDKVLIISYTKLVKNITSYYPPQREARKATEKNDESFTLNQILSFLSRSYTISPMDLNKGVKFLWDKDFLDCHRIESRQAFSTRVDTMNGDATFKEKYPADYQDIIKKPLGSAVWKYLQNDDDFCESFVCDLSGGTISVSRFAKHAKQIENVIAKILANN